MKALSPPWPPRVPGILGACRVVFGYLLLAVLVTWPLARESGTSLVGYESIDSLDTVVLRGAVAELLRDPRGASAILADPLVLLHPDRLPFSTVMFFPVGFPLASLAPNLLDHLLAFPLVALLPFPLSDNLWWIVVLVANGLAAHRLGARLGGSRGAGWLVGVAWMTSENLLREVDLHHAPQALVVAAPLFLLAWLDLLDGGGRRASLRAASWWTISALSYWYHGLFLLLAAGLLALARFRRPEGTLADLFRRHGPGLLLVLLLVGPALAPFLGDWGRLPLTRMSPPGLSLANHAWGLLPEGQRFVAMHGSDPLFPWRALPVDRSNRISIMLVVAAILGGRGLPRWTRRGLWAVVGLGFLMVLGPILKWGEAPVWVAGHAISLPFAWLGALHPFLGRLFWPERWGLVLTLGLVALAARAGSVWSGGSPPPRPPLPGSSPSRAELATAAARSGNPPPQTSPIPAVRRPSVPYLLAGAIIVESWCLSQNLPTWRTDRTGMEPWRNLSAASGAVLELPLRRGGLDAANVGLHGRYHRRPLVNPLILPPGCLPDPAWERWMADRAFFRELALFEEGRWPRPDFSLVEEIIADGVTAVALDLDPGASLSIGSQARYREFLSGWLGQPVDYGAMLVWWLIPPDPPPPGVDDGDAWREGVATRRAAHSDPVPATLIKSSDWLKRGGPSGLIP